MLRADLVLSAAGLRARTALAVAAGLAVNRGIEVDALLATSSSRIYAIGDCAEVMGTHLPFVLPIMHGARALANTLAGEPAAVSYPIMPITVKTPALPVTVVPPRAEACGEWMINGDGRDIAGVFVDTRGKVAGFALTGAANARKQMLLRELTLGSECGRSAGNAARLKIHA
jgi:rubredoxin-NAD+ reductase